ncbi:hypothetical protein BURPSS13_C0056 [Burkholderia pseudomallei S13]|nr:hypothetical protein BURPSS13_C0056 [Burkholderia pseudomallei S13]
MRCRRGAHARRFHMRAAFTCASLFRPTTACRRDLGMRATCRTLSRAGGAAARVPTRRIDESTNRRLSEGATG